MDNEILVLTTKTTMNTNTSMMVVKKLEELKSTSASSLSAIIQSGVLHAAMLWKKRMQGISGRDRSAANIGYRNDIETIPQGYRKDVAGIGRRPQSFPVEDAIESYISVLFTFSSILLSPSA